MGANPSSDMMATTPASPEDSLMSSSYQQQTGHYVRHVDDEDNNDNEEVAVGSRTRMGTTSSPYVAVCDPSSGSSWSIANFGQIGQYSRDGSPHVTDEVFNSASHLAALVLSILGSVLLISQASAYGNPWKIVSFSIYGASLIFLFGCSTLHHAIVGSYEGLFRMLDYMAIYPLIAGTFTPLCLVYYHDSTIGWAFCGTVWGLSILGMIGTACYFAKIPKWMSMTLYITLGWLGACMTAWLIPMMHFSGFSLFLLGGILYTAGGYVYTTEAPNPIPGKFGFHEIWHVAVVLAAFSHWLMMYFYVLAYEPNDDGR